MALDDNLSDLATGMSVSDAIESYLARVGGAEKSPSDGSAENAARGQSEAIVEIMFLVAAVDGDIAAEEIAQLEKSALDLSGAGALSLNDTKALLVTLGERLEAEGWSARMHAATGTLTTPEVRRLAYRLGAGVAFVDDRVEAAEAAALDALAKTFELADDEAHALLVEVQTTLFG